MTTAPGRLYRDPLEILEWAERHSCKGCVHKSHAWGVEVCEHPKRQGGKAERKCKHYSTGEEQ